MRLVQRVTAVRHRRLITLLLVLALPLPGLAALGRAQAPCPMQADAHAAPSAEPQQPIPHHGTHHPDHGAADHAPAGHADPAPDGNGSHCCDEGTFALFGGACQPGQHCQSVSVTVFLPAGIGLRAAPAALHGFDPPDAGAPPKASPTSIWRPPAV